MERIKEALEKARLERQRSYGGAGSRSITPGGATKSRATGPISYTQTRTVKISRELLERNRIITGSAQDIHSDAYRMLRTQVMQRMSENQWNVLAVTSPGAGEGKTLTAINLAISLAMELDYTVLLVDADLRKPGVHSYFDLTPEYGLSDYLTSDIQLSELLIHPDVVEHLVILPGGNAITNSSEMLSSPKMKQLVEEVKNRYSSRIILFDVPPLLATADALAFSPYVDAALLVIEEGKTTAEDAKYALDMLQGTSVIGTVLNKADNIKTEIYATETEIKSKSIQSDAGIKKRLRSLIDKIKKVASRK